MRDHDPPADDTRRACEALARAALVYPSTAWVTVRFAAGDAVPLATLCAWVDESCRAVAPKRLVKLLDESREG
jgi:hypothetical protein